MYCEKWLRPLVSCRVRPVVDHISGETRISSFAYVKSEETRAAPKYLKCSSVSPTVAEGSDDVVMSLRRHVTSMCCCLLASDKDLKGCSAKTLGEYHAVHPVSIAMLTPLHFLTYKTPCLKQIPITCDRKPRQMPSNQLDRIRTSV
jgi:hypothetical protein